MCVPLLSDTGRLGVLNLSTSTDKLFNLQDLDSIQLLATYSSIALQNVLQFIELKNTADGLRDVVKELGAS